MDLDTDELLRAFLDSAEVEPPVLSEDLSARVLSAGLSREKKGQHHGWSGSASTEISALAAFVTTAVELAELLDALTPGDWDRSTRVEGATVRDIAEHLVGVERYVLGQLGRGPAYHAPERTDHWSVTRSVARDLAAAPTTDLCQAWWREVLAVAAASGELGPDQHVSYHHLAGSLRGLLIVRTFELWTHGDDIRGAIDVPLSRLDEPRLALMVNELMTVLPLGLALSGCQLPGRAARFNLSGPGGGSYDVPLAPGEVADLPDITLTADAIDLCRLASNRLSRDEFGALVEGDVTLLAPILVGATAFAAD